MGGFGYFDTSDRQYRLFVPPEVADYSVSAIRVESDAVWLAIFQSGEYGGSAAGVLRYDRQTEELRKYGLPDAVYGLTVSGNQAWAATSSGIAVIDGDRVGRYFVDLITDGRLRITQATR